MTGLVVPVLLGFDVGWFGGGRNTSAAKLGCALAPQPNSPTGQTPKRNPGVYRRGPRLCPGASLYIADDG